MKLTRVSKGNWFVEVAEEVFVVSYMKQNNYYTIDSINNYPLMIGIGKSLINSLELINRYLDGRQEEVAF